MTKRRSLFSAPDGVEHWVRTNGVRALRALLDEGRLDEHSAFIAQAWLLRFESDLQIALEQGEVRLPTPALHRDGASNSHQPH